MTQRLIWNFELHPPSTKFSSVHWPCAIKEKLKWEIRYFWPEEQVVPIQALHADMLDLANYEHKHREDCYFLLPKHDYNVKRRSEKLLYKPLLEKNQQALGFGEKINLNEFPYSFLHELKKRVEKKGHELPVKKEVFIYSFPSVPKIKVELSRLQVHHQIYLSACIEGRSQVLVKKISQALLPEQVSCEYVSFLKQIK